MSEPDIVAELDAWLASGVPANFRTGRSVVQRARDAIAGHQADLISAAARARGTALEEAALACEQLSRRRFHVCDHHSRQAARECVRAIRALMDKRCQGDAA